MSGGGSQGRQGTTRWGAGEPAPGWLVTPASHRSAWEKDSLLYLFH